MEDRSNISTERDELQGWTVSVDVRFSLRARTSDLKLATILAPDKTIGVEVEGTVVVDIEEEGGIG